MMAKVLKLVVSHLVLGIAWVQAAPQSIEIAETQDAFSLTVQVSALTMTIPKGSLTRQSDGSTNGPRYFSFGDSDAGLAISGWFEPASAFAGLDQFWEAETASWTRNGLPRPLDTVFEDVGSWDAIIYDLEIPQVSNSHIRAHLIRSGTWIDIHLSISTDRPAEEARALLRSMLNEISVVEKN